MAALSASPVSSADLTPAQKLILGDRLLVIAHRGNSSVTPENTLPAFQSAIDVKSDLVELDYYHAADGVPVVIHDDLLDRTTNAEVILGKPKLSVREQKLSDLRRLDTGSWFDKEFAGAKLPTLVESLDLIQARSVTLIERKKGDAPALIKLLEEKKLLDTVVVQAFDFEFVAECRKLAPRLALGALCGKPANDDQIRAAVATGADLIVWDHKKIGRPQIELIHRLGKKAWIYTVDDLDKAKLFITGGIDGIITNTPAEVVELRNKTAVARSRVSGASGR